LTGLKSKNENHVFAAFAVRVGLEINEGDAAGRLSVEAVRSHMRILKGVVGNLVLTTSPSEPILAIASALALNRSDEVYSEAVGTLLEKLLLKGLIQDRGLVGELSSRLLFLRAMDKTMMLEDGNYLKDGQKSTISVRPVRVSDFLMTLLGNDLGVSGQSQEILRDALLREFSDGWMNFTHFVQLPVSINEVTPLMLFQAWCCGAAFYCVSHQPVIDGFFVVYFGHLDRPFNINFLFIIPWQTKARCDASGVPLTQSLTAPFLTSHDSPYRTKPRHLVILMDLATPSAFGHARGPHCSITSGRAQPPEKQDIWGGYAREGEVEGFRYCISVRGHRSSNYPILDGNNLEKYFDQLFSRMSGGVHNAFQHISKEMEKRMLPITLIQ
jgi:hypothetical protein